MSPGAADGASLTAARNPYMYAKCIWKMYQASPVALERRDQKSQPSLERLIGALEETIQVVWALPKSRPGQDPILEPHYKIVSVVHKLVTRGDLPAQEAADILQRQPFAVRKGEHVEIKSAEDWKAFVIEHLTFLKEKDKSNWQHRIIMRHAGIVYNDPGEDEADAARPGFEEAVAAFGLLQKTMFTKTMVMNVWKCDAERPGRHHVYTEQYVRFMVKILVNLKDRDNFELLIRKLRKRGGEFYHFNDLWVTSCMSYLRLIRQHWKVQPVLDDVFKNMSADEFEIIAERLLDWATDPKSQDHPAFEALKEVVEFKKVNTGLMKAGPIDDLICDCYTAIFFEVGKSLPGPTPEALLQERAQERERAAEAESKPSHPFSGLLNPQSVDNAGAEAPAAPQEGVVKPRRAGVRRPDIVRKAEQAATRAIEGPVRSAREKALRASVSSTKPRGSRAPTAEAHDGDVEMKDEDHGHESSPARSVHDSADDESDLSDVPPEDLMDEEEAALLFPGLVRRATDKSAAGKGADEGDEEEADEMEDGDEEEEQEGGDAEEGDEAEDAEMAGDVEDEGDEDNEEVDEDVSGLTHEDGGHGADRSGMETRGPHDDDDDEDDDGEEEEDDEDDEEDEEEGDEEEAEEAEEAEEGDEEGDEGDEEGDEDEEDEEEEDGDEINVRVRSDSHEILNDMEDELEEHDEMDTAPEEASDDEEDDESVEADVIEARGPLPRMEP